MKKTIRNRYKFWRSHGITRLASAFLAVRGWAIHGED